MSVLVTGGDGFVGCHLVAALVEAGHDVHATTLERVTAGRRAGGPPDEPRAALADATWHRVDVLDPRSIADAVRAAPVERVFHLAGFSSGGRARARPAEAVSVNAVGTVNLLDALAAAGTGGRIVVAGSGDVYGPGRGAPFDETCPLAPAGPYGASKAAQEIVALALARRLALDVRVARLFPLVGPGQADAFVVPSLCRQIAGIAQGAAEPVVRVGNLDVERDFTDVRDGVDALLRLAALDTPRHRAYNVCSGRGVAIRTVLGWVLEEAGVDPRVEVDPDRVREGEPRRVVGTPARLAEETGWSVERDVRRAVVDTYRWVAARPSPAARS